MQAVGEGAVVHPVGAPDVAREPLSVGVDVSLRHPHHAVPPSV